MGFDADCKALLDKLSQLKQPRYETLTPSEARDRVTAARQAAAIVAPDVGSVQDILLATEIGNVPGRLYRPAVGEELAAGLIFFHGGGWVLGDLESHDILCRRIANAGKCVVIAVDYRLAPEHKFPAAVDDAVASAKWISQNTGRLGIDPNRLIVAGDSAGANLAAVACHAARNQAEPRFRMQLLLYPVVELGFSHNSHELDEPDVPILGKTLIWFRDHYLSSAEQQADWRASPLLAETFEGLPPAYVLTAGYDPLADEGIAYVQKLRDAGITVEHCHYEGQIHGFLTTGVTFPTTENAISRIGKAIRQIT
jgi:acetyl esterase